MSAALYAVKYGGGFAQGGAVLYVGNGIIAGMDVGEILYDGTYVPVANGGINGIVTMTAKVASPLVTGATLPAGQSINIPVVLPVNFGNGASFSFNVGGATVPATFTKIKDLP